MGPGSAHEERILAALFEEDQKRIRASAPRAIRALQHLIEDPEHKDHARGIGMVLDRVHPLETRHTVDVVHHVDHPQQRRSAICGISRSRGPRASCSKTNSVTPDCPDTSGCLSFEDGKEQAEADRRHSRGNQAGQCNMTDELEQGPDANEIRRHAKKMLTEFEYRKKVRRI